MNGPPVSLQTNHDRLKDILVLSVKKSFWASKACSVFPNRIYTHIFYGYSQNLVNSFFVALRGLIYIILHRPKLILFGSTHKIVPLFLELKRVGLLSSVKLIATNQEAFSDRQAQYLEKIIIYSRSQINLHNPSLRDKYEFMPLPADGEFDRYQALEPVETENYIFTGGGEERDFRSLIEAVKGLDIRLKIVTFSEETLGYSGQLPENCDLYYTMPLDNFMAMMAKSLFVVVPLQPGARPHGHTTVVQALRLGKAVITTKEASVEDYVSEGGSGLLVASGDVEGYRRAIMRLMTDHALRHTCEQQARQIAQELTYTAFAKRIVALCKAVLTT